MSPEEENASLHTVVTIVVIALLVAGIVGFVIYALATHQTAGTVPPREELHVQQNVPGNPSQ